MQDMQEMGFQSLGREDAPGVGNGSPLQYSCLENSMHRGAWRATVHGVTELDMTQHTHTHTHTHTLNLLPHPFCFMFYFLATRHVGS